MQASLTSTFTNLSQILKSLDKKYQKGTARHLYVKNYQIKAHKYGLKQADFDE